MVALGQGLSLVPQMATAGPAANKGIVYKSLGDDAPKRNALSFATTATVHRAGWWKNWRASGRGAISKDPVNHGVLHHRRIVKAGQKHPGISLVKVDNTGLVLWQFGVIL